MYSRRRYCWSQPWEQLVKTLNSVRENDRRVQGLRSAVESMGRWGCLFSLLSAVAVGAYVFSGQKLVPELAAPVAVGWLVGFVAQFASSQLASFDLENHRYEVALDLLTAIRVDLDCHRPVSLTLDFRSSHGDAFREMTREKLFFGLTHQVQGPGFRQPWFSFEGRTSEGHRIAIEICRKGKFRSSRKKNRPPRERLSYRDCVEVRVCPPQPDPKLRARPVNPRGDRFKRFAGDIQRGEIVVRAAGARVRKVRVGEGSFLMTEGNEVQGKDLVSLLLSAFRCFPVVARLPKSGQSQASSR